MEEAETETATLRGTEGLKAADRKLRKLMRDKRELEQKAERLRDVIVMQGQVEILRDSTGDAVSEKDKNPYDQAQIPREAARGH